MAVSLGVFGHAISPSAQFQLAVQVLFVQEILRLDSFGFGILLSVAAAGSIFGSQCAARLKNSLGPTTAMLASLATVGWSLGLVGLSSHCVVLGSQLSWDAVRRLFGSYRGMVDGS
ncbi:MFS transporter [Lihuaxuella thermophila]|uniref:MFS transporter n=1 Tax=Lihuaxuella thermophila TaxID=1173111 RepID=UPI001113A407|nr:MFS transporter [Lihuaxuella thermophila]